MWSQSIPSEQSLQTASSHTVRCVKALSANRRRRQTLMSYLCSMTLSYGASPTHSHQNVRTVRNRVQLLSPWCDAECRTVRRRCRQLERLCRRSGIDSENSPSWQGQQQLCSCWYRSNFWRVPCVLWWQGQVYSIDNQWTAIAPEMQSVMMHC